MNDNKSIQKDQFCNEIINSTYIHHLQYVELSKSLSEIFSTNFDKEIADLSIALYRLHKKLVLQMQKDHYDLRNSLNNFPGARK